MELTAKSFLIVCPMLFLAGLVDAIGGGGGLISLPAYLLAGLPVHQTIATNKLSSTCGTSLATWKFLRQGLIRWRVALPAVGAAILGSTLGANLSLVADTGVLEKVLFVVLPVVALVVLSPRLFHDNPPRQPDGRTLAISLGAAFVVGIYDGFYGPGTGTFLILAFTVLAKMDMASANAQTKVINLTTNITSLIIFLLNGQVVIPLGLAAAVCNMAGNYLGASLALTKGSRITRPVILVVLALLFLKILGVV